LKRTVPLAYTERVTAYGEICPRTWASAEIVAVADETTVALAKPNSLAK
jgi:hypothetical protein